MVEMHAVSPAAERSNTTAHILHNQSIVSSIPLCHEMRPQNVHAFTWPGCVSLSFPLWLTLDISNSLLFPDFLSATISLSLDMPEACNEII